MSRSFDNHESLKAADEVYRHQREQEQAIGLQEEDDNRNNSLARMIGENDDGYETASQSPISAETQVYFQGLRLNHAVRDLLLNHFACLFYSYDSFVISEQSSQQPRDSVANFDKASFLSDQPDSFLPFLAAFLETQMFASFIDSKILSHLQSDIDENVVIFDSKIKQVREKLAALKVQTPTIEKPADIMINEEPRLLSPTMPSMHMDYEVRQPHILPGTAIRNYGGFFPDIDRRLFETNPISSSTHSPWKQQKQRQRNNSFGLMDESSSVNNTPKHTPKKRSGDDPTRSQAHWKFVEQLLKETKTKTKRMLVMKMGKEAVHLGHNDLGVTGVEENTLVAGFCDLLERVWAHGLKKKHGKSALWTHVLSHQEREKYPHSARSIEQSSNLTPEFLPVPKTEIDAFEKAVADSNAEIQATASRNSSGGLNELIESLRQLSKPSESPTTATTVAASGNDPIDDSSWSKSFLKAANFIADKLAQPEEDDPALIENNNDESYHNPRARREPGRPLPRSSSVTRFASWASSRIREVTTPVITPAAAAPRESPKDVNGNPTSTSDAILPPPGNPNRSRVSDITRPPIIKRGMHKSSSVSG
uniref:UDENN domain-containing protein n=1 Tax=Panagrolaimus davidi TaxID=227884 RepID=A0A914Q1R3_9BILA